MSQPSSGFDDSLEQVFTHIRERHHTLPTLPILSPPQAISESIASLLIALPNKGKGTSETTNYLINTLLPGILQAQNGPRYFGFVTGGVTESAQLAEVLSSSYDENIQVTLPGVTASTAIESRTLELVLDLVDIQRERFMGRTITTGATSSNVLGLACARDYLYSHSPHLPSDYSYAQDGPPSSPTLPSPPIIILALHPHYSILKAASLVGIGAGPRAVQTIPASQHDELAFDMALLRDRLEKEKEIGRGVIVSYGLGEVNTGGIGSDLEDVAELCEELGAWLHVDAAFGGFAGLAPGMSHLTKGMDKAHSLTLDGHKWLNVPYDCGLFYTRHQAHLTTIFSPPAASVPAYLSSSTNPFISHSPVPQGQVRPEEVPSPLYVNIENSRRFRALPLLASLISLGKDGYRDVISRNITFAREIATFIRDSESYELLNPSSEAILAQTSEAVVPMNIVLFRGSTTSFFSSNEDGGAKLSGAINATRRMYVTATKWRGQSAVRLAVSNWRSGGEGELDIIKEVLTEVARDVTTHA